jgi:hypothetical protein
MPRNRFGSRVLACWCVFGVVRGPGAGETRVPKFWQDFHRGQEKVRLLLLGAGESGKSTVFKQVRRGRQSLVFRPSDSSLARSGGR